MDIFVLKATQFVLILLVPTNVSFLCTFSNPKNPMKRSSFFSFIKKGECAESYSKSSQDETCNPINLCLNSSTCHVNATCHYTGPATHECHCKEGYAGNGFECEPICSAGCENGGQCIGPEECACPSGFQGPQCQDDIDECALGQNVHKCSSESTCVNKAGW